MKIEVLGTFRVDGRTYEQSRVSCGKRNCRCMQGGELHGPYWYRRYTSGGVHRRRYIGRILVPDDKRAPRAEYEANRGVVLEDEARDFLKEQEGSLSLHHPEE